MSLSWSLKRRMLSTFLRKTNLFPDAFRHFQSFIVWNEYDESARYPLNPGTGFQAVSYHFQCLVKAFCEITLCSYIIHIETFVSR